MKKNILLLFIVILVSGCSKKTTETIKWQHDTTTVERLVVQEKLCHDTITVTADKDRETFKVVYDTLERVREVVVTKWKDKIVKEQGATTTNVVRDTVFITHGNNSEEQSKTKTPSNSDRWVWWGMLLAIITMAIIIFIRDRQKK